MGNEESVQTKKNYKPTELEWNDLFSLQHINELFKKITNQDIKNTFDPNLNYVFFSSLIENLIYSKSKAYQLNIHSELKKSFFLPLDHDLGIDLSRTFTKCFDELRSTANTIFERENISKKRNNESIINSFHSIKTQKTPTCFLENFFTIPINYLLPLVHVLEISELSTTLNNLNNILSERKNWSLDTFESSTIISLQKLINRICQIEKFRVPEIQILIIKFLFNFANAHGNINSILSVLQIILSFPVDFSANFDQLDFNLQGPKLKDNNLFTFPFEIDSKILSFSIGSNVLVLAEWIGLIQFVEPEPLIIPVNTCDDSIILDTYQFIYIFSIKLGTIQCFTNNDINIQSMRILDISKYVNIKHKLLACGKYKQNITLLQSYGRNKYRITIFNNNLENDPNKVSEIKLDLSTIQKEEEMNPKFYYFNRDEVHFIYDDMVDKPFKIFLNDHSKYEIEMMPDLICSSFISDNCPIGCFRKTLYSISQRNGMILFIKNEISPKTKIKQLPFNFTNVNLPIFNNSNRTAAVSLIINELSSFINSQLLYLLKNRFCKYILFFIGPENSTFDLCFTIIQKVISDTKIEMDIKMTLVSILLKIISINLSSYCTKFVKNMKQFNDQDKQLFNSIKGIIELTTFSVAAVHSPLIIEAISFLISANFHYLFYPDYSSFNDLICRILSKSSIRHHLILNLLMLSTNHCFLYMFSSDSINILQKEIKDENSFQQMFNNSLLLLNEELQFLNENGIKSNEQYILPYIDFLLSFLTEKDHDSMNISSELIQNLIFRLMLIDSYTLIALKIVEKSIPIVQKFTRIFQKDIQFIEDDRKYSTKNLNDEEKIVFESNHNVEPKIEIKKEIKFENGNIIHLSFDKKCHTDLNDSSLRIFDVSNKKFLLYSFSGNNWIDEIDIVSSSILIEFTNDSKSDTFWGFKVTCSSKAKQVDEFKPCMNLFYFNLMMDILGRLTLIGLKSTPQTIEEIQCKFILEGDLLEGVTKLFNQKDTQIHLQQKNDVSLNINKNKPLTKGLSNGLSYDATIGQLKYPDEIKKEFINDLICEKYESKTIASSLLDFMYKAVKAPHLIRPNESILLAEKYMIAALMKQLGFINSAISFGTRIIDNENESFVIPPNLDKTWKSIYKMRTLLYRSYQKSKEKIMLNRNRNNLNTDDLNQDNLNNEKLNRDNVKLFENFDLFINEIIIKCKFLLFTEPILKKRNYQTENYDMETIEKTINELLSFITSELLMENLNRMVEKRTEKIKIRTEALKLMIQIIQSDIKLFKTTKMSYLYPLKTSLKLLSDHSDVKSVSSEKIKELNDNLFELFELIISMITDLNESESNRLFYIKMLSANIEDVIQTNQMTPLYLNLSKFIQFSSIDSIESFVTVSSLWRILGFWTLEFQSIEIIQSLVAFSTNPKLDFCRYHSILLLAVLSQTTFYIEHSNISINQIFECFVNASPRVVVATFIWLANALKENKNLAFDEVELNGVKYDLKSFIRLLLKGIGSALVGGSCLLLTGDDSMHESSLVVASELISFLRVLIQPSSMLNKAVSEVFHKVLEYSIDDVMTKYVLKSGNEEENDEDERLLELIAVFSVLGKEIISFHNSGYSIHHTKEMSELVRVTSYEPSSGQLKFILMNNNNFNEITADKQSKFVPSARVPSNPHNFLITESEVKSFVSIQNKICEVLENFTNIKFSIFSASFIGFLTVCLQNEKNAKTFVKTADLTAFLGCANKQRNLKKATGIEKLINRISTEVTLISNIEKQYEVTKIQHKKLPYSLVFNFESPQRFIPLTEGRSDDGYRLYSYSSKSSLFVGDRSLPNSSLFYFEVRIVTFSTKNIAIGFLDHQSTQETVRISGIGLKMDNIFGNDGCSTVKSGDVIGCEYVQGQIHFFLNGVKLKHFIQSSLIDDYVPAIGTRDCEAIFEYNFGHKKFITDMKERMEAEILRSSCETFDVKVPIDQVSLPSTNLIDGVEYDAFVGKSNAVWEISKPHPNDSQDAAYFTCKRRHFHDEKTVGTIGEMSLIQYVTAHFKYYIGEPVLITLNSSQNKENKESNSTLISPSTKAELHYNKYGNIVEIQAVPNNGKNSLNLFLLTIESIDSMKNKKYRFQISSEFVTPINCKFMKIVENATLIYMQKDQIFQKDEDFVASIVPVFLKHQKSRLFNYTRSLIIKMCRFLSLVFVDYFRLTHSIPSYFDGYKRMSTDVFLLVISDVFKFIVKPKISPKLSQYRLSDFIFTQESNVEGFSIGHFCLCNTHMTSRLIRSLIYQNSIDFDSILVQLISNSIDRITEGKSSSRDDIFTLVSKKYILESVHPLTSHSMSQKIEFSELCNGFIPVSNSMCSIGRSKIKINDHEFKGLHEFDYSIFPQNECKVSFRSGNENNLFGFLICMFPITPHLNEKVSESSLGGIHILFTLLSIILSEKDKDNCFSKTVNFLKQDVIQKVSTIMNKGNFFVDLFAFEIIQPILMCLRWNSIDISPKFEEAFNSFTSGLHKEVKKWELLHNRVQQGALISLFTRLLILDISTESSKEMNVSEISYLYDTFVKSKIDKDSTVYDQLIEAIATCVALGFDMPIPIKFPAFLIAEKWAENIQCSEKVVLEKGRMKMDDISFDDHLNNVSLEFVAEDWMPSNCALKVTQKVNNRSNSKRTNAGEEQTEKCFILKNGEKIAVNGRLSIQLVKSDDGKNYSPFETAFDDTKSFHIKVFGYPSTHESKRSTFVSHFTSFKNHVSLFSSNWDVRYDEALSRIIKANPSIYNEFPLNTHEGVFFSEPLLSLLPSQLVACRLHLFNLLESYMPKLIKVVDIGNKETIIGGILSYCRSAISTTFKLDVVKNVVEKDLVTDGTSLNIKFNRFQASLFYSKPDNPAGKSLLDQLISQVPQSNLTKMKRQVAPWKVDLIGEGATDAGGPGRDLFTEACMELMNPTLDLFVPNPNKRVNNTNGNQELLIPNPQPLNPEVKTRFIYAGALIALCYVSSIPEPFKFPRFFWDFLTNKPVSIEDIYEVDLQFKQLMTSIENCEKTLTDPSQFSDIFALSFQVQNSLGEMVDLIPGGNCVPVTFIKRLEYVQRCKAYRVKEFNDQLTAIRQGFNIIFPPSAASILTPWEIELLICGDNKCPIEELKKNCNYEKDDKHSEMLWNVLERFSPAERMLFIKFGCGRMGLPPPGMNWKSKLSIRFKDFEGMQDSLMPLPTAVTCNSKVTIPRYTSIEWMEKKVRTAITMGADIDQDRNARINDLEDVT